MERALVTGAAGFIGCHLVEALAETGTEIGIEFCDAIPLLETGKRSPVVSTVQADFQALSRQPARRAR